MTERFTFPGLPARVVFGRGALAAVPGELERLGASCVLIVTTPGRRALADRVVAALGARAAEVIEVPVAHVPIELATPARRRAEEIAADACLAIGGGSAIGLAKAIALTERLAIAAVPTTLSGSEMTPIWGLTDGGLKLTGRDPIVAPRTVVYDPELFDALPGPLAATSGLNALAHCAEATYAPDATPLTALLAAEGAARLARALPAFTGSGSGAAAAAAAAAAVDDAVTGAWLAGCCLATAGVGLHHKLCHTLGGTFGLPHAETHAVLLPHALAYNRAAASAALAPFARALGPDPDPARAVFDLARRLGAPRSLAALGLPESALARAAELAVERPYPNPRPLDRAAILALLHDAHAGAPPR